MKLMEEVGVEEELASKKCVVWEDLGMEEIQEWKGGEVDGRRFRLGAEVEEW